MGIFLLYGAIGAILAAIGPSTTGGRVIGGVIGLIVGGLWGYLGMPTLGWGYAGIVWFAILFSLVGLVIAGVESEANEGNVTVAFSLFGALVVGGLLLWVTTTAAPFGKADQYRAVIGEVSQSEFSGDVSPVDINSVRTVSQSLARLVGEKRLGEIAGLGSRVNLGTMNIQAINGCFTVEEPDGTREELCFQNELFWAGPLVHSGIFKQWGNRTTPGYILVSATDPSDVVMVTAIVEAAGDTHATGNSRMGGGNTSGDGAQPLGLRYLNQGGYFSYDLKRHLRTNGYLSTGITDFSFEIRDDGRPFWVVTRFEKRVGFGGPDANGVVVVDAQTGEINAYSIEDAPAWVDRIQPHTFIDAQLDDWGQYIHGFWNLSGLDKMHTTSGISLVFGADGQSYWYTGIQSVGADTGTMGFVLVNTRTKEARWFQIAGATETAAVQAAENAKGVKEAGYTGSSAILYNVANVPTYFTVLHGDNGMPQMYAFVNVEDYSIVGVGESPRLALRDYQLKLSQTRSVNAEDLVDRETVEAVIAAVATEVNGESQTYYFLLQGKEGKEYYASSNVSIELKWTRVGDRVELVLDSGESASVNIIRFNNLEHALE